MVLTASVTYKVANLVTEKVTDLLDNTSLKILGLLADEPIAKTVTFRQEYAKPYDRDLHSLLPVIQKIFSFMLADAIATVQTMS